MTITITKPPFSGQVPAIPSKSHVHRLLIAAALSQSPTTIACGETSDDIDATVHCLRALGAAVNYDGGVFTVSPIPRPVTGQHRLDCGESGSTLRFMLPVGCALGAAASYCMSGRLPARPLSPLYEELTSHGCALSAQGQNPLNAGGKLKPGRFVIPGDISSQFISGLLLALPILEDDSIIKITGTLESKPYIDLTLSVLTAFGIDVSCGTDNYRIRGRQRFASPGSVAAEGDWSGAAAWLCLGALTPGGITVTGLDTGSPQGDKAILDILRRFGAQVDVVDNKVTVTRGLLAGTVVDAADTPDLVPVLTAVAAAAEGQTVIRGAGRLRIKESDRLKTVTAGLSALGADIVETRDGLVISGKERLKGGAVAAAGDHRLVMMAAVAAAACDEPVIIRGAEAVSKSYPRFFKDYAALGGLTAASES